MRCPHCQRLIGGASWDSYPVPKRKAPERCCGNSMWPIHHDADCGQRTEPLEGEVIPPERPQGGGVVGARVYCTDCGRPKKPWGRDSMNNGLCDWECPGYDKEPRAGTLWPGETRDEPEPTTPTDPPRDTPKKDMP